MRDTLEPHDWLRTQIPRTATSREVRVIGSMGAYLLAEDGISAVLERLASEQTRIVSLTVTETGYRYRASTGDLDVLDPEVRHDLADPTHRSRSLAPWLRHYVAAGSRESSPSPCCHATSSRVTRRCCGASYSDTVGS